MDDLKVTAGKKMENMSSPIAQTVAAMPTIDYSIIRAKVNVL